MEDFKKIKEFTDGVRLSGQEKAQLRANILRTVRTQTEPRHILQWSSIFSNFNQQLKPMTFAVYAALFLSLSIGGAASFAAESALPGDVLYSVKTSVNEKLKEVLAFSTESKGEVEASISEERLEEAAELAAQNRFDGEARANLEANFERHAEKVQIRIEELQNKGKGKAAADLSARFENSIEAHSRTLEKLDGEQMGKFLPKIGASMKATAKLPARIEAPPTPTVTIYH